ncbi:hypothetical protein ABFT51_03295 [Paenibacillus peoriae]|uniref:hypothetical protein n=1 Tax=Paenibacillus peoriae TaxID=59893 RepID=UPI0032AFB5CC
MKMDMQKHVIDMLRSAKTVFVAQDKEGNGLAIDPHDALGLVDSLQQQVAGLNEESLANFQTAAERGKQLAERDRTIARLTEEMKVLEKFPRETGGTGDHVLDFDYLHMIKLEIGYEDRDFSTLGTDDIEDVLLAVERVREEQRAKALGRE